MNVADNIDWPVHKSFLRTCAACVAPLVTWVTRALLRAAQSRLFHFEKNPFFKKKALLPWTTSTDISLFFIVLIHCCRSSSVMVD